MWLQIFARTFTDLPPSWTEEISRLTFIWFGILASCYTLWKKQHMQVDILYVHFNPTVKRVVRAFGQICIIILGSILLKEGIGLLKIFSIQLTSILRWPMTVFYTVMPVSGFLYLVIGIYELIKIIWADELDQAA
jgi:TRAP-type C4-dicarboxylate transport system permease small subunit